MIRRLMHARRKFNVKLIGRIYVRPTLPVALRPMMAVFFTHGPAFVAVSVNGGPRHIVPVTYV